MINHHVSYTEFIGIRGEPPELKHLSRARKRNQPRFPKEWRAKWKEAKPEEAILLGFGQRNALNRIGEQDGKLDQRV